MQPLALGRRQGSLPVTARFRRRSANELGGQMRPTENVEGTPIELLKWR